MTRIAAQVPALFEALSGMDIKQLMANVTAIKTRPAKGGQAPVDDGTGKS
jgi:flotillin